MNYLCPLAQPSMGGKFLQQNSLHKKKNLCIRMLQLIFFISRNSYFSFVLGMVMYANEVETKEK